MSSTGRYGWGVLEDNPVILNSQHDRSMNHQDRSMNHQANREYPSGHASTESKAPVQDSGNESEEWLTPLVAPAVLQRQREKQEMIERGELEESVVYKEQPASEYDVEKRVDMQNMAKMRIFSNLLALNSRSAQILIKTTNDVISAGPFCNILRKNETLESWTIETYIDRAEALAHSVLSFIDLWRECDNSIATIIPAESCIDKVEYQNFLSGVAAIETHIFDFITQLADIVRTIENAKLALTHIANLVYGDVFPLYHQSVSLVDYVEKNLPAIYAPQQYFLFPEKYEELFLKLCNAHVPDKLIRINELLTKVFLPAIFGNITSITR